MNRLRTEDEKCRSRCDHKNYCIARMYSVDMKCCYDCEAELPRKIKKEIGLL